MSRSVHSVTLAVFLCAPTASLAQPARLYQFNQPAQDLSSALHAIAEQTGIDLVIPSDLVAGRSSPSLEGTFTADQALENLLRGSGLAYRKVDTSYIVGLADLPSFQAKARPSEVVPESIVVTGSNVRGAPPTSPVITLERQIRESGATSVEDLMRKLPQNVSAGVGQENFAVPGAGADITQHGAGLNLRGLGQRATLVLINGRRVAPSDTGSFVDVSLIPISAVERVEVLTDGASAIYGSDAVGGVVNFILKRKFEGIEPIVQFGTTTEGGGPELLAGVTVGHAWGTGRALLSYEYRDEAPIRAIDRSYPINLEPDWFLRPDERRHSIYGNLRQDLARNLTLEVSGLFADRHTRRTFFDASQIAIAQDAHARSFGSNAALRLDLGSSWVAEASGGYSRSQTRETEIQAGQLFNRQNARNEFRELGLKADGSLIDLPGGALKLAVGGILRREQFASVFASRVNVATPIKAGRTVSAAYAELNAPIVSKLNRRPGFEQLTLTAAGRIERYEGVGSSANPKIGVLWSPAPGIALRGSYGTSFRAPLLSESNGYYNVFLFPVAILYRDPSSATSGVGAAVIGNNPGVKPERSKSLSLGIEATPSPTPGLRVSANYYRISFTNRIALPSPLVNLIGDPAFAPVVTLSPATAFTTTLFGGANQLLDFSGPGFTSGHAMPADVVAIVDDRISNTAATRTKGLDLLLNYDFQSGPNDIHLELNANRVFAFDDKLTSASPWIKRLDTPYNPIGWRARTGGSWRRGALGATAFVNYAAAYRDNRRTQSVLVHPFTTVDAGLTLDGSATRARWLKPLRLALQTLNLFDARPPHLSPNPGSTTGIGYDPVNANGQGRVISLQLRGVW